MTTQSKDDAVGIATLDDSIYDVDLMAVDDLIDNATRLLNEVLSNRPMPPPVITELSPREDAIQQVQRFLNSIRDETNPDDDVVFVEERPGNAPPSTARTLSSVVDLCSPSVDEPPPPQIPCTRRRGRRSASSRVQPESTPPKTRRRQVKNEPDSKPIEIDDSTSSMDDTQSDGLGQGVLQCPICMTSVLNRRPSSTKCGHIFCQQCIFEAIRLTKKCPICKAKLKMNEVHRVYF